MSKLYFIRHGQSEWNVADRICGATDIPLTDKGREQARESAKKIIDSKITADIILYSPLSRAKDTAEIISELTGIPCQVEEALKEQNFGKYEGTSPRNAPNFQAAKQQFINSYDGGESMLRLAQRIYNLLDRIKADNEKNYILVAHNGIARVIKSYFEDMTNEEYASFGVDNCSVTEFELNNC